MMTDVISNPADQATMNDRLRVMVVDDDDSYRSFVLRVANRAGWQGLAVSGPEPALAALSSFDPHVIMLDLSFPELDGLAVLSELAPRCAGASVVLISACDPEVLRSAHRVGLGLGVRMLDPISKPVTVAELTRILEAFATSEPALTAADVRQAIDMGAICLSYQPKVCLATGAYRGVEALARWPVNGGFIPPSQFVPVVERDESLSLRLLDHALMQAVADASAWRDGEARCAVNMSALCLADHRLPDRLCQTLQNSDLTPADFVLELTETAALRNPDRVERILTGLRIRGFAVSLDDFGTGHSSLLHLQRMPFNEIKIDQTFVASLLHDQRSHQIVALMVAMGRALDTSVVAEGIETEDQARVLREMNCDVGQGYLYARPLTPKDLEAWRGEWESSSIRATPKSAG